MPGIYIHIPFCKQACHYCNFHFSTSLHQKEELVKAIIHEITLTPPNEQNENIETVYFGGGTPSILIIDELKSIMEALQKKYSIDADAEITLEANPDDISSNTLQQWKSVGINRLSLGVQSFSDAELQWMNRTHASREALVCIDEIQQAGFSNFSVDMIYGSPLLSDDAWKKSLDMLIEKKVPHLSCYALTIEPRTALNKMIALKKRPPIDSDKQAQQFLLLINRMEQAEYEQYEISNFAKPGKRSIHNSSYWQGKTYYGFGPSAHSYSGKKRKWNIAHNNLYIQSLKKNVTPSEEEQLTSLQQLNEYIMMALRTKEGIDLEKVSREFGNDYVEKLLALCNKWEMLNRLFIKDNRVILTTEGKLFADGIAADFFF